MAAQAAVLGLPGWRMLTTDDTDERLLLIATTMRARELADERDDALARRIRNEVLGGLSGR
jgi:hypothetical protein